MSTEKKKYYKIAEVTYCVIIDNCEYYKDEGVLCEYVAEPDDNSHIIEFYITETLPKPDGELIFADDNKCIYRMQCGSHIRYEGTANKNVSSAYMCICREYGCSKVFVKPRSFGSKTVLRAMELEHFVTDNNGVLFHCAYITVNRRAILFTAPSGVGKSTQADLWVKHQSAELINGDRCALVSGNNCGFAYGVPYCGSSGINHNIRQTVDAIVYLRQAPFNSCRLLKGLEAFKKIWEGICVNTWNHNDMENALQTVTEIAENVPVILLECTPDISAVAELQSFLRRMSISDEHK